MVRNKKIKVIGLIILIAATITACNVQKINYAGLYVDKDYAPIMAAQPNGNKLSDSILENKEISISKVEIDSLVNLSRKSILSNLPAENQYLKQVRERLGDMSDSLQLLHLEIRMLQQYPVNDTDNSFIKLKLNHLEVLDSLRNKKDTISQLREQLKNGRDAVYKTKTDSLKQRKDKLQSLQNLQQKQDSIYLLEETIRIQEDEIQAGDKEFLYQELREKDEIIRQLQKQLILDEKRPQLTDTVHEVKEILVPSGENTNLEAIYKELNIKNDTIRQLRRKLNSVPDTIQKTDTVYKTVQVPALQARELDSVLITAYYDMGKTTPSNNIMGRIREIAQNESIEKAILSGYTDVSGNTIVNKKITNSRLDYIKDTVAEFLPLNKIFLQNFADTFASNKIVNSERRVEITFYVDLGGKLKTLN
ncbi:hypothetical protein [Salegentibacter salarius]|uniref:OmpA-like domain-containing protein n=1 Tax=Salegentibacter salarius TaxID=435906 RepID=A0A2N0TNJ4_9FLAO|nr:hypothetical protein [Salegentibacter salarius]OEY71532.1 hypothetical protein BHS39_05220 [Salegentibacter salarius]PKD16321.1 hypothetical protein APR40_05220 [Salegentibacter salarius]SLJ90084.1 hypothetical protein SAMN05660445_00936 [Salegentibacter salarius]